MKNLLLLAIAMLFSTLIFAQAPAQKNMTLLSNLTFPNGGQLSNLWGYTAPNGTEYAIVGMYNGVSIVSLSDPTNPVEVQFLPGVQTIWREVKTFSHYAYISNEGGDGIRIIDLAGLPTNVIYKDTIMAGIITSHTVSETDGFLYINGSNINGGIDIFNLNNDPWHPEYVGAYTNHYVHDCYVRGNTIYAGEIYDGFLGLIDITNKNQPQDIALHSYANSFTHNTWLNDAGNVCFTTDEVSSAYIYAWDVSDPSNIKELDKIKSSLGNGTTIPHNIHIKNDYGVTAYYTNGVAIFDVSHPNSMVEVGYYDTSPYTGGSFNGCWGVYPYFQSGHIIASDMEKGLFVLNPNYMRGCYLQGTITDAVTGNPLNATNVTLTTLTDNSNLTGNYGFGIADSGTYQVLYSKMGYTSQILTVSLINGAIIIQDVKLQPLQMTLANIQVLESGTNLPISNAKVNMITNWGLEYNVSTTNGQVSDSVAKDTYNVIIGKWGYVTKEINLMIDGTSIPTIYLDRGYYDDFALDLDWTIHSACSDGMWERVKPKETKFVNLSFANPGADINGDIGEKCFVTGGQGLTFGDDDIDGGSTTISSPIFDLVNYNNAKIYYNWWFVDRNANTFALGNDHLKISISNGIDTILVKDYTDQGTFWTLDSFLVNNFISPTANMQLIVEANDISPTHTVEAAFDKFRVVDTYNTKVAENLSVQTSFSVSPNPIANNFSVSYHFPAKEVDTYSMEIYDITGKMLKNYPLSASEGTLSVSEDFPQGLYLIALKWNNMVVKSVKVVKE